MLGSLASGLLRFMELIFRLFLTINVTSEKNNIRKGIMYKKIFLSLKLLSCIYLLLATGISMASFDSRVCSNIKFLVQKDN